MKTYSHLSPQVAIGARAIGLLALSAAAVVGCRAQGAPMRAIPSPIAVTEQAPQTTPAAESGPSAAPASERFSHVTFTPPAGWTRTEPGGWLQFSPPDVPPGQVVAIQLSPGGPSSRDLAEEFAALVRASANGMTVVNQDQPRQGTDRQGLKTIRQTVLFQDAKGGTQVRDFFARRSAGRFEALVFTASSTDLAERYAAALRAFTDSLVYDGAAVRAPNPGVLQPARPAATTHPAPAGAVHFSPMATRPMYITGRVVFENGQPIPQFHVHAAGFSGKFSPFLNNTLSGPQVRQTGTTFAETDGNNGQYAMHMVEDATMTDIKATALFHFDDMYYTVDAWPTDNLRNGAGRADYRGRTPEGIVRDFVLKLQGVRPGYDPASCPDHEVNVVRDPGTYYGGTLVLSCGLNSITGNIGGIEKTYAAGSIVSVTLTPNGSRVDGLPARTVTRTCPVGTSLWLYGIPYADYTATAQLTEPGGAVHDLRLAPQHYPLVWQSSVPIQWKGSFKPDVLSSALIPTNVYLGQ